MQIAGIVLGYLLLGQAPDALLSTPMAPEKKSPAVLEPAFRTAGDGNHALAPAFAPAPSRSAAGRLYPPEMVAEAIVLPPGSALTGQPLTLLNVLTATPDRRQQLEMTRMYWNLVQAVAEYHYCLNHAQELGRIKSSDNEVAVRLTRASAAAMLRQAELDAAQTQYELARMARLPANAPLPLPADRPHVGEYRTYFQELFAGRTAPEPAALMERILPIERQTVDEQAAVVQAAEDVLAAAKEQQQTGRGDAADVAACSLELLRQQRTFIRTVCQYNRNIADYSLVVTGPTATPQALVATLIGPVQQAARPAAAVQPTSATEPLANPTKQAARSGWKANEPTLAPPRTAVKTNEPTLAPPRDGLQPASANEPTLTPPHDALQSMGKNEPTLAPPPKDADKQTAAPKSKPLVPVDQPPASSSSPQPHTANKPVAAAGAVRSEAAAASVASPLYPALLGATPVVRAKQLTVALHWDRSLPEGIGKSINLADCLRRDGGTDHRTTIETYWRLRQRAAEYQVLAQQAELLDSLEPVVLDRRNEPSGAVDMLRLHESQLATQASLHKAHTALVEVQYALAMRIGATHDATLPLASTVPHSGRYLLELDALPPTMRQSWPIRRLATMIPGLCESVEQRASAVVEADAARVAAAEKYRAGGAPIDQAVEGIATQTKQTLALLETLTDYNRAIAEYVVTVLPPATAADKLVTSLVVKP